MEQGCRTQAFLVRGTCRRMSQCTVRGYVGYEMQTYAFHDTEFMSACGKELVRKAWVRFLKHGLRSEDFSRRLYDYLHLHCGFIAHYNRRGFYDEYFESGETTACFLSQFDKRGECRSVESGIWLSNGEYEDLAKAMIEEGAAYIPDLMEKAQVKEREADLAEARRLVAKHGLELDRGCEPPDVGPARA